MAVGTGGRVDWVDYAKGICIVLVVMMHSTYGVEAITGREGFMHQVVLFARPFRMPDFFLISGLFLSRVIDRNWRDYLDRKVVHFAYFYVLWTAIQFGFKAPLIARDHGVDHLAVAWLETFIEPFGTLWFIYLLPIFFVVTKLVRSVPPWLVLAVGAALEMARISTGWTVIDEFAARFVYFYAGYLLAGFVFRTAETAALRWPVTLTVLAVWALVNGGLVFTGYAEWTGIALLLGFAGAAAVMAVAVLLAKADTGRWLRFCGEHSLVIYLAFFLPMSSIRQLLIRTGVIQDVGVLSLMVTASGVIGALGLWMLLRNTRLAFLYRRPEAFHLRSRRDAALTPAE